MKVSLLDSNEWDDSVSGPGIVVAASGLRRYLTQALALAISVRRNSPETPVAVITDIPLEDWERSLFAGVYPFDFVAHPALGYRFHFDQLAVFAEGSLFVDSDTLCYGDLSDFLAALSAQYEVTSFVYPETVHAHWFHDKKRSTELNALHPFSGLSGDVHFVKPGVCAEKLFVRMREIAGQYDELGMARWRGGLNDEPVFALAYWESRAALAARDDAILGQATSGRCRSFRTDCLNGRIEAEYRDGRRLEPLLFHYEMFANRPAYHREVAGLLASVRCDSRWAGMLYRARYFVSYLYERRYKLLRKICRISRGSPAGNR